jgi:cytidine deaminase
MDKLYKAALDAYHNTYSPYSNYGVGASIELNNGEIFSGTNIENASFGLTNCAERSAVFSVYSKGYRKQDIKRILVLANSNEPVSPCGACRQVLIELMDEDAEVILTNLKKDIKKIKVKDLLPYAFTSKEL